MLPRYTVRFTYQTPSVGTCTQYVPNAGSLDPLPLYSSHVSVGSLFPELRPPDHRVLSHQTFTKNQPMVDGDSEIRDAREKHSNQHTRIAISENPFQGSRLKGHRDAAGPLNNWTDLRYINLVVRMPTRQPKSAWREATEKSLASV
eukprot:7385363-Prymnesium_polylepis.1